MNRDNRQGKRTPRDVRITMKGGELTASMLVSSIGQHEAPAISRAVVERVDLAGRGLRRLVLDLSAVDHLSSMGLGLCIDLRNRADRLGAVTELIGLSDDLLHLIQAVKVDRLFEMSSAQKTRLK